VLLAVFVTDLFQVPSLLFLSSHAVSVITLGVPSGLVIDCGYSETVVLPVNALLTAFIMQVMDSVCRSVILCVSLHDFPTSSQHSVEIMFYNLDEQLNRSWVLHSNLSYCVHFWFFLIRAKSG